MVQEPNLLKELKKAYKYYIEGNVIAFDETLTGIILSFSSDAKRIINQIKKELNL